MNSEFRKILFEDSAHRIEEPMWQAQNSPTIYSFRSLKCNTKFSNLYYLQIFNLCQFQIQRVFGDERLSVNRHFETGSRQQRCTHTEQTPGHCSVASSELRPVCLDGTDTMHNLVERKGNESVEMQNRNGNSDNLFVQRN